LRRGVTAAAEYCCAHGRPETSEVNESVLNFAPFNENIMPRWTVRSQRKGVIEECREHNEELNQTLLQR
jgi:hypothetical protein